jgi:iron complex outermembrane receptor protein
MTFLRFAFRFSLVLSLMPLFAQGSDDDQKDQEEAELPTVVEELTVTSRKREEKLQEIPLVVNAFSEKVIEDAGIESLQDFIGMTPNFIMRDIQNTGTIFMTMRGISQVPDGDAPVAMAIDGVLVGTSNSMNRELYDIERIEVLKGPQGAMYGRNAIGGAINIITKSPTVDAEHHVKFGYGNEGNKSLSFSSSGPISDRVFYRAAGYWRDHDGWIPNDFLDINADSLENTSVNFKLSYIDSDRLNIDFRMFYSDVTQGVDIYIPLFVDGQSNNSDINPSFDQPGVGDREIQEASLKLDYTLGNGLLTFIAGHSVHDEIFSGEADWTPAPAGVVTQVYDITTNNAELRWTSDESARLGWIVGGYYQDTTNDRLLEVVFDPNLDGTPDVVLSSPTENENTASAFFVQSNIDLTDKVEASVSLRYDRDKREQFNLLTNILSEETFDKLQSQASISYEPNESSFYYFSYSEGFRSGGFNPPGISVFPPGYDEETTANFEIGAKLDRLDNRLRFNASLFHTNYEDAQTAGADIDNGVFGILTIDEVRIQGAELELSAVPMEGLQIGAAVGFTDSEIKAIDTSNAFFGGLNSADIIGNTFTHVPEHTFNLSAQYRWRLGSGRAYIRADYEQQGELYWHVDNVDERDAVNLLDARVGFDFGRWSVRAWSRNLTDEGYTLEFLAAEFNNGAFDLRVPSVPRSYGVECRVKF